MSALQHAGDLAHARSRGYQRRRDQALTLIDAATAGTVVGVSWGKDSVALLSLAMQVRPMPVVHYRWPDLHRPRSLDDVRDEMIARYRLTPRLPSWETDPAAAAAVHLDGYFPPPPSTGVGVPSPSVPSPAAAISHTSYLEIPLAGPTQAWQSTGQCWLQPVTPEQHVARHKVAGQDADRFRAGLNELGATGTLIGMRGRESKGRMMHLASRGLIWHSREWERSTIAPLGWWTAQDVWARHAEVDLPAAAHYRLDGWDRDRIRSEIAFDEAEAAWRRDLARFWRTADPELWARLTAAFPQVQDFGS